MKLCVDKGIGSAFCIDFHKDFVDAKTMKPESAVEQNPVRIEILFVNVALFDLLPQIFRFFFYQFSLSFLIEQRIPDAINDFKHTVCTILKEVNLKCDAVCSA